MQYLCDIGFEKFDMTSRVAKNYMIHSIMYKLSLMLSSNCRSLSGLVADIHSLVVSHVLLHSM